ncbi:MAG: ATP-binding protein [Bacteroidetes bacterium]|nr:ATP-binding protein [Bacteroidota bacterium]MCB0852058.1 ATP-binding protein [Bacteroidota bacterium]
MRYFPIGKQNFEDIIKRDLHYVDKTRQVHNLLKHGDLYFLSRPRRFGKSLLISTFKHLFSGKKELFKDLYIGKETDYSFEEYPVLQFNFAAYGYQVEILESELLRQIQKYATQYDVEIDPISLSTAFKTLVAGISEKEKPVVILIDEYDKPIVDFLTEYDKAKINQGILRDFFSPLKDLETAGHLRFLFITGVSKFSKVSLFSDLNNLTDLTVSPLSHDLLGITQQEMETNFQEHIQLAAQAFNLPEKELLVAIKTWYNGYSYDGETKLYNPFSLLNFLNERRFANFWFATGTPTFLVKTIRDRGIAPEDFEEEEVASTFFDKFSLEELDMTGLLFQTGYLTIKRVQQGVYKTRYFLDYPNLEVKNAMMHNLVEAFTFKKPSQVSNALIKMERGLEEGKPELFVKNLTVLLSDISYHLLPKKKKNQSEFEVWEGYFHTIVYLITSFMGMSVKSEITSHKGRLDLMVESDDFIYLMEFKLDKPAKDAIKQIKNRKYAAAYANSPKTVFLMGIGFSKEERNVETWESEVWERGNS